MTDTLIAATEGGLLPRSYHGEYKDAVDWLLTTGPTDPAEFLKAWNEGDLDEWPEFYKWLATRTPSPCSLDEASQALQDHMEQHHGVSLKASEWDAAIRAVTCTCSLGEDVVERVVDAFEAHCLKIGGLWCREEIAEEFAPVIRQATRAALSALRPVQEEGVGEAARFAADMALAAELRREAEITAECGIAWREDTPEWRAADRLEALTSWAHGPHGVRWYTDKFAEMKALASHSDASPPVQEGEGQ